MPPIQLSSDITIPMVPRITADLAIPYLDEFLARCPRDMAMPERITPMMGIKSPIAIPRMPSTIAGTAGPE